MSRNDRQSDKTPRPPRGAEADFGRLPESTRRHVMDAVDADNPLYGSLSAYLEERLANAEPGELLTLLRVSNRLTQDQVARQADPPLRQAEVSAAEGNIDEVKFNVIKRIAKVMGLRPIIKFVPIDDVDTAATRYDDDNDSDNRGTGPTTSQRPDDDADHPSSDPTQTDAGTVVVHAEP